MPFGVVLRCRDLETSRSFYESRLGIRFTPEKHGNGPHHYAAEIVDSYWSSIPPMRGILRATPTCYFRWQRALERPW